MTLPATLSPWRELAFFESGWPAVSAHLARDRRETLPPEGDRFRALERVSPDAVRVVILGQDPYPTAGHADGLAFSVRPGTEPPRSLKNIFKELKHDLGVDRSLGDLTDWADQGVLLLNTALSVPAGHAGGHAGIGWEDLVRDVLGRLSHAPRSYILWGRHAQKAAEGLHHPEALVLRSAHPSPLSASRGFFGSRPFSRVNDWLTRRGERPVDWSGSDRVRRNSIGSRT